MFGKFSAIKNTRKLILMSRAFLFPRELVNPNKRITLQELSRRAANAWEQLIERENIKIIFCMRANVKTILQTLVALNLI